jgi:hypothetical protein
MAETYSQIAAPGPGDKIRNLTVRFVDTATDPPTVHTVLMQVINIADEDGRLISLSASENLLSQILAELRDIKNALTFEGITLR